MIRVTLASMFALGTLFFGSAPAAPVPDVYVEIQLATDTSYDPGDIAIPVGFSGVGADDYVCVSVEKKVNGKWQLALVYDEVRVGTTTGGGFTFFFPDALDELSEYRVSAGVSGTTFKTSVVIVTDAAPAEPVALRSTRATVVGFMTPTRDANGDVKVGKGDLAVDILYAGAAAAGEWLYVDLYDTTTGLPVWVAGDVLWVSGAGTATAHFQGVLVAGKSYQIWSYYGTAPASQDTDAFNCVP